MGEWMNLCIPGIASIKKLVGEFVVEELLLTPYAKFKVKIYQNQQGTYQGHCNLMIVGDDGFPESEVGVGDTIEEALEDTITIFISLLKKREILKGDLNESDFQVSDHFDF